MGNDAPTVARKPLSIRKDACCAHHAAHRNADNKGLTFATGFCIFVGLNKRVFELTCENPSKNPLNIYVSLS